MNFIKATILGLCIAGCVGTASAQTKVYLTGSTAYRGQTVNAIKNQYGSGNYEWAYAYGPGESTSGGANGAHYQVFHGLAGTLSGVYIITNWSGSEGGIQAVADGSNTEPFLDDTAVTYSAAGADNSGTLPLVSQHADVAMSDTFQTTSQFRGLYQGVNYATLTEATGGSVGVVPFKFITRGPSAFTNITTQQFKQLASAGKLPLAMLTGNTADHTKTVILTGRDPDSGTRVTTLAETGYGAQLALKQYQPQDAGGAQVSNNTTAITQFNFWPDETVNGIFVPSPNGGFDTGGKLKDIMRGNIADPVSVNGTSVSLANLNIITYLSTGDAKPALTDATHPCQELSYNGSTLGIPAGDNYNLATTLTEGQYTFWGYEHMYYGSTITGDATKKSIADGIAGNIRTVTAAVLLSNMQVQRTNDGAKLTPKYSGF